MVLGILAGTILIGFGSWFAGQPFFETPNLPKTKFSFPSQTIEIRGETKPTTLPTIIGETTKVTRVIDGDTVAISDGRIVRYIGMDSPERGNCFFEEAKSASEALVKDKEVWFEKDVSEVDKYNRLLRYAFVGDVLINEELIRDGFAVVSTYPPDVKYKDKFLAAQEEARDNKKGVWGKEGCSGKLEVGELSVLGTGEDKDCGDFKTHDESQSFFIAQGGPQKDPHKLDSDGDGVACETLP